MPREFSDQELVRRAKAEELSAQGIDPFGKSMNEQILVFQLKKKLVNLLKKN